MRSAQLRRNRLMLAAATLAALSTAIIAALGDDPAGNPDEPRTGMLGQAQARAAQETVARLQLTPAQARKLLPIVDRAAALRLELYQREAALLPEVIDAFRAFAAEDARGQGFTPQVERLTARLSHQLKSGREQLTQQLIELEAEAAQVLSARQRKELESADQPRALRAKLHDRVPDRLAAARAELAELSRDLHPTPGRIGRYLLHPAAGEALARIARCAPPQNVSRALEVLTRGTEACPLAQFERQHAEVVRLREEINNWNLINGLNLSAEQIERIISLYDEAKSEAPVGRRRPGRLAALEKSVAEVLNDGQREVLRTYKACLIPPKNLKDPVRVGQAGDSSHLERWLEQARAAPDDRLARLADALIDREIEHLGRLDQAERHKRKALLLRTARRAAAMSDVEFALRKSELAQQITPRDRRQELREEIDRLAADSGQPGLVARFLLKPSFIEQLRQRAQQMAADQPQRPSVGAELLPGSGVEHCVTHGSPAR